MTNRGILSVSARAFVSSRKRTTNVNKVSTWEEIARCSEREGGNPVTIFYPFNDDKSIVSLTGKERITLAKSCAWESVIVEPRDDSNVHTFRFFMPSGEEVSFCGHAAIGASAFMANRHSLLMANNSLSAEVDASEVALSFATANNSLYDSFVCGNRVKLIMDVLHEESDCNTAAIIPTLDELLHEMGLKSSNLLVESNLPFYINSSVARPKTLIPIKSVEELNAATPPNDPDKFCKLCDSINSTGIYLYSKRDIKEHETDYGLECRQFPRASGYAEDPATGIAAGALAASLYTRGLRKKCYSVNQGTSMGRPSSIQVEIEDCIDNKMTLSYSGSVVLDSITQMVQ